MYLSTISINTLCQLKSFLASISDEVYTTPIKELSNATIGQHTRHIIEFYSCFIEQTQTGETINYDKRLRDLKLETSIEQTISKIETTCSRLEKIKSNSDVALEGTLGESTHCLKTSTERELLFSFEHAVHHMAIIKIAIKTLNLDINLSSNFGIAESTLAHKKCVQ